MDVFKEVVVMVKVTAQGEYSKVLMTNKTGTENVISSCN